MSDEQNIERGGDEVEGHLGKITASDATGDDEAGGPTAEDADVEGHGVKIRISPPEVEGQAIKPRIGPERKLEDR